jgi:polar amino acid transport system permease protein
MIDSSLPRPFDLLPALFDGLLVTIQLTLLASIVTVLVAVLIGLARLTPFLFVRVAVTVLVEVFRGTSLLAQVYFGFFVLPLAGITLSPMEVGVAVLGLNFGAYGSEVVRASVLNVDRTQREAAVALNMTPIISLRRVILPQAVIAMVPPFANILIELLKATSLVSLILLDELTRSGQFLFFQTGRTVEIYALVLLIYFALAVAVSVIFRRLEHWVSKGGLLVGAR